MLSTARVLRRDRRQNYLRSRRHSCKNFNSTFELHREPSGSMHSRDLSTKRDREMRFPDNHRNAIHLDVYILPLCRSENSSAIEPNWQTRKDCEHAAATLASARKRAKERNGLILNCKLFVVAATLSRGAGGSSRFTSTNGKFEGILPKFEKSRAWHVTFITDGHFRCSRARLVCVVKRKNCYGRACNTV